MTWTTQGLRSAQKKLLLELRICRMHRRSLRLARRYAVQTDLCLHLGCGHRSKTGYVNIDLFADHADLHLDLREPLPFRKNSVAVIESEHFLEHLSYPGEVRRFLCECMRVMKPGGLFSVGVPDAEASLIAYAQGDEKLFQEARRLFHPAWCTTPMHQLNYLFRQGEEHRYAWDFRTLSQVLDEAGFVDIRRRPWDADRDSPERRIRTLFIDAQAPR